MEKKEEMQTLEDVAKSESGSVLAKAQEEAKAEEAPSSEKPDQETNGDSKDGDSEVVDYKAELERITKEAAAKDERLRKAEYTLTQKDKELRALKRAPVQEEVLEDGENEDEIEDRVAEVLEKAKREHLQTLAIDNIESELEQYSDDPDRQTLIKYHYDNTIQKSGLSKADIKKDLAIAAFLADRPKFEKRMQEVNKAIAAEKSAQKGGVASGTKSGDDDVQTIAISAKDFEIMKRHGLTEKDIRENIKS